MECKIFAVKDIRDNSKIVERMFSLMKKHYENMKKDKFLLKEVAEKLGTSKSTIRNDLKNLKKILLDYNIKLLQDDKLKYYFAYSEEDYRYFIAIYLYKYVSFDKKYDKIFFDDISYFRKVIYKEIKEEYMSEIESVSKRIKKETLKFKAVSFLLTIYFFQKFLFYLGKVLTIHFLYFQQL